MYKLLLLNIFAFASVMAMETGEYSRTTPVYESLSITSDQLRQHEVTGGLLDILQLLEAENIYSKGFLDSLADPHSKFREHYMERFTMARSQALDTRNKQILTGDVLLGDPESRLCQWINDMHVDLIARDFCINSLKELLTYQSQDNGQDKNWWEYLQKLTGEINHYDVKTRTTQANYGKPINPDDVAYNNASELPADIPSFDFDPLSTNLTPDQSLRLVERCRHLSKTMPSTWFVMPVLSHTGEMVPYTCPPDSPVLLHYEREANFWVEISVLLSRLLTDNGHAFRKMPDFGSHLQKLINDNLDLSQKKANHAAQSHSIGRVKAARMGQLLDEQEKKITLKFSAAYPLKAPTKSDAMENEWLQGLVSAAKKKSPATGRKPAGKKGRSHAKAEQTIAHEPEVPLPEEPSGDAHHPLPEAQPMVLIDPFVDEEETLQESGHAEADIEQIIDENMAAGEEAIIDLPFAANRQADGINNPKYVRELARREYLARLLGIQAQERQPLPPVMLRHEDVRTFAEIINQQRFPKWIDFVKLMGRIIRITGGKIERTNHNGSAMKFTVADRCFSVHACHNIADELYYDQVRNFIIPGLEHAGLTLGRIQVA